MTSQTFEVSEAPTLTVPECLGDLSIKGTDGTSITVKASGEPKDVEITQEEDAVVINVVRGDLRIKGVNGNLTVGEVNGDASLRDATEMTIDQVHGDLRARHVGGDLTVQSVAGDARIDDVSGKVAIGQVGSDLKAGGVIGGLDANAVGSDVHLSAPFEPGTVYNVRAGSDLIVDIPEDASLRFTCQAGGGVRANIPDVELLKEGGSVIGVMGTGEATLNAQVGGRVLIKMPGTESKYAQDFDVDIDLSFLEGLDELGPMIEARVSEAMANLEVRLEEGLQHIDGDRIRAHVERATERATRAAERIAERAQQAAEREAERARRTAAREAERSRMRAEHAERRWQRASGHRPPTPPAPTAPPTPPIHPAPRDEDLREERLQVLRMVEEGKITAEEAANLLSALR